MGLTDFKGNELAIGDPVIVAVNFCGSVELVEGVVTRLETEGFLKGLIYVRWEGLTKDSPQNSCNVYKLS